MNSLVEYFLSRSIFVNLLTVLLLGVGGYLAWSMNREAMPNVEFDIVSVTTIYVGASPQEVEKLVTNPLEESLQAVDGIREIFSGSIENRSGIIVTLDPDITDKRKVLDDIQTAVDSVDDLPDEAEDPYVVEFTTANQAIIRVSLARARDAADKVPDTMLRDQARILEDELNDIDGVARVDREGWRAREIQVDLNPNLLARYYLSPAQVVRALQSRNLNFPGGEIEENNREIVLRTVGELNTANEIAHVYVRSNDTGQFVQIRNVAHVAEEFEDSLYIDKTAGSPSITLVVRKQKTADIIKVVNSVKEKVSQYQETAPEGLEASYVQDFSYYVKRRLGVLMGNGLGGLALVVGSLFIFMGWRTSLMVALGIPISFAITLIFMDYYGVTINLISMLGLIIVVGIVVDDAIIVSENFYRYLEEGHSSFQAALKGTMEVVPPVTATIATTVAAFGPLLFMTGIMGKFIHTIPLVIIIALLASLFECFFILPAHLSDVNTNTKKSSEIKGEGGWFDKLKNKIYLPALRWGLGHKKYALPAFFALLIISVALQVKFGRFKLFTGSIDAFQVKITTDRGYTKERTEEFTRVIEEELAKIPDNELDNFVTRVGMVGRGGGDPSTKRGSNYAKITVYLQPEIDRERSTEESIRQIRDATEWLLKPEVLAEKRALAVKKRKAREKAGIEADTTDETEKTYQIPDKFRHLAGKLAVLDIEKFQGGPPVGKAVSIEITGNDFPTLQKIADEYKTMLGGIDGIEDIDDDFEEGKDEVRITINERLASQVGVSVFQAATAINTAFQGTVATSIKRPEEEVNVRIRFAERFRKSLSSLNKIRVMNAMGNLIPVSRIISQETAKGITSISHRSTKRLVTVTANVDESVITPRAAATVITDKAKDIPQKFPGYKVELGGENRDTEESMESLGRAFIVAILLIFMILASLFRSMVQPLVVLSAVPFAMIGVILAFLAHDLPLSFLAMMGIIGLAGVVVNDSIVLVNFANNLREEKPELGLKEAVIQASGMRLRAVMLTTITTVFGLLPTAYGWGGYDPFLVPMTLAFAWGLVFATTLTLGLVPILYYMVERVKLMWRNWRERKRAAVAAVA